MNVLSPRAATAADAGARAGVQVAELRGLDQLGLVDDLFRSIWGSTGPQVAMPVNLLQAFVHTGGYVAGAWRDGRLVAAGVAFLGRHGNRLELHSHVAGVARDQQGRGVGLALKLHQREWAAARGIDTVTWTYDPLNRRNGWFNLGRLGARATAYYPDFYGVMVDDLNGTDETDRCLVRWPTGGPLTSGGCTAVPAAAVVLAVGEDGMPVREPPAPGVPGPLVCQVPEDAVALRRADPAGARRWRLALRATMGAAMADGFSATGFTRDGYYVLERVPG